MLLALDDTDSPTGGCTTALALDLVEALDLPLAGLPRLVRLNPNVPWKTRGNGAVILPMAKKPDLEEAWAFVQDQAQPGSTPAMAWFDRPPDETHYWSAVRTVLSPGDLPEPAWWRGSSRALIGCIGAAAWPAECTTYERLAYREPARIGTPREVTADWRSMPGTFGTFDHDAGRTACVPNTPCPVLYGVRAHDADALSALPIEGERPRRTQLWLTNQGTGDHITRTTWQDARPGQTIDVDATVEASPRWVRGGRLEIPLDGGTAVAFEPSGRFRHRVAAAERGDRVRVVGAWDGQTVRLESWRWLESSRWQAPSCCRTMKKVGPGRYRCPTCNRREPGLPVDGPTGHVEPPVMGRRHLHPIEVIDSNGRAAHQVF